MKINITKLIIILVLFFVFIGLVGLFLYKNTQKSESILPSQGEKISYAKKTYRKVIVINKQQINTPVETSPVITPLVLEITPEASSPTGFVSLTMTPTITSSSTSITTQISQPTITSSITGILTATVTPPESGFLKPSLLIIFIAFLFVIIGFAI